MKLIIDCRMRKKEKEYISKFGEIIEITQVKNIYEEISSHPDIFICKLNNKIILSKNLKNINIKDAEYGNEYIESSYPNDIKYNVCQIGNNVVHDFRYTDKKVKELIEKLGLNKIQVKQGYSNCSISVINENACITSDIRNF